MKALALGRPGDKLSVLCLGAHSDDIEIGAGGSILQWITSGILLHVHWCVLSASGRRAEEARASAADFLRGAVSTRIELGSFRAGFFPYLGSEIKTWIEALRTDVNPDVILTHRRQDAHQDHRLVCDLTWNIFHDHLILEYEIPKWDGDLARPNLYVPLDSSVMNRKIELLLTHFGSQKSKDWFDAETFRGLARLRGMECRASQRFAEAFMLPKAQLN